MKTIKITTYKDKQVAFDIEISISQYAKIKQIVAKNGHFVAFVDTDSYYSPLVSRCLRKDIPLKFILENDPNPEGYIYLNSVEMYIKQLDYTEFWHVFVPEAY